MTAFDLSPLRLQGNVSYGLDVSTWPRLLNLGLFQNLQRYFSFLPAFPADIEMTQRQILRTFLRNFWFSVIPQLLAITLVATKGMVVLQKR